MVKQIVKDTFFLGQKSEETTVDDIQVAIDLADTLNANRSGSVIQIPVCRDECWNTKSEVMICVLDTNTPIW